MTFVRGIGSGIPGLPGQIFENLVFYVDAADPNCYPGTGTNVTDIEGNGTNGLLSGGVTFADAAFRFTATSGEELRFAKNGNIDDLFSGGGTLIVFARPRSAAGSQTLATSMASPDDLGWRLRFRDGSSDRLGVEFTQTQDSNVNGIWRTFDQTSREDPEPLDGFTGVRPLPSGVMSGIAVVYDNSSTANDPTFYIRGERWDLTLGIQQIQGPTGTADTDAGQDLLLGFDEDNNEILNGDLGTVLLFDRELTSSEVDQIFNAFGSRYGLASVGLPGDVSTRQGQDVVVRSGTNEASSGSARAGNISVIGGDLVTSGTTNSAEAGKILIRGGNSRNAGGAGDVNIFGGRLDNSTTGGAGIVTIAGGRSNYIGAGGDLVLRAGDNNNQAGGIGASGGGDLLIRAGDSLLGADRNSSGGSASIRAGAQRLGVGGGSVTPGDLFLRSGGTDEAGGSTAGSSGDVFIYTDRDFKTGDPQAETWDDGTSNTFNTGGIFLTTESQATDAVSTGSITFTCGSTTTVTGSSPGAISLTAGAQTNASNSTNVAGDVDLTAGGNAGDGVATTPGFVNITAGSATNGSGVAQGGDICLTPGTAAGTGRDGKVIVKGILDVQTSSIEATAVNTSDSTSGTADPIDVAPGTSATGFDGADLTLSGGTAGSGGTPGRILQVGDCVITNPQVTAGDVTSTLDTTEFRFLIASSPSGDGKDYRITAGTTSDTAEGGSVILEVGTGVSLDGQIQLKGNSVFKSAAGDEAGTIFPTSTDFKFAGIDAAAASGLGGNSLTFTGGAGDGVGDGGDLVLQLGASGLSGAQGTLILRDENGVDIVTQSLEFGNFTLLSVADGQVPTDAGFGYRIEAGAGNTSGKGGTLTFRTGAGGNTTGDSGDLIFDLSDPAGSGAGPTIINRYSDLNVFTQSFDDTTKVLSNVLLDAPGVADAGSGIRIETGDGGATSGDAGSFVVALGTATGSGSDGKFVIQNSDGSVGVTYTNSFTVIDSATPNAAPASGLAGVTYQFTIGDGEGVGNGGGFKATTGASGAGAIGNGGLFEFTAGAAASTNGDGGGFVFGTGAGAGTGPSGDVRFEHAEPAGAGANGGVINEWAYGASNNVSLSQTRSSRNILSTFGDAVISGDAGTGSVVNLGAGNGAADGGSYALTSGPSGTGATGKSGDITFTTEDAASTNGDSGSLILQIGLKAGSGQYGDILLQTNFVNGGGGAVSVRTQTSFTGTAKDILTHGVQHSATLNATTNIVTIGTLSGNGRNMKFNVFVTAQDNTTDTSFVSAVIEQSAYHAGGSATLLTAHRNDTQGNGALGTDLTFDLSASGSDVILRVINANVGTTYTVNVAVTVERQEGGFSS